jgi:hypothetical protein
MDLSDGKSNDYIIANILNQMAPPQSITGATVSLYKNGTIAKILCTLISNSTTSVDINSVKNQSAAPFLTDLAGSNSPALTNVSFTTATIPAPSISTTRIIKTFIIEAGAWRHVPSPGDINLPA